MGWGIVRRWPLAGAAVVAFAWAAANAAPALADTTTLYVAPDGSGETCTVDAPCALTYVLGQSYGANVVVHLAAGTYVANSDSPPTSATSLTLDGAGASNTILTGENDNEVFASSASYPVTINDLTLEDGSSGGDAADLLDDGTGSVTLDDSVVNGGSVRGGLVAVASSSTVTVENSTIENASESAQESGAATFGTGILVVEDSTFAGDPDYGVYVGGGTADVSDSTLTGQSTDGYAAAANNGGDLNVVDSTFSGDLYALYSGDASDPIDFAGNILAATHNCDVFSGATYNDSGYNVETDSSCPDGTGDKQNVTASDLGLGMLADNGGPTQTESISTSSAAYDSVPVTSGIVNFCYGDDQRGLPRTQPLATMCDAGAYQIAPPTVSGTSPAKGEATTSVTITGTNLSDVTSVIFGTESAQITAQSQTSLTVVVPDLPQGSEPITVTNADGSYAVLFTVTGPTITTTSLPTAAVGSAYSQALAARGGTSPYTWKLVSGSLPPGLSLSGTGTISGTPTVVGRSTFEVEVTDADGESDLQTLSLTVPSSQGLSPSLKIDSKSLRLKHARIAVTLSCSTAPCSGTIKLASRTGKELASVSYKLAAGARKTFELKLTKSGKKALKRVSKHKPVKTKLSVSLKGGATKRKNLKVT